MKWPEQHMKEYEGDNEGDQTLKVLGINII